MVGGPAREQAYQQLAALLDRGVYPPGSRLPGERSLAEELKVSRSTLRLALVQLAEDNRLVASAQRGWFVPQLVLGEPPSQLISFTELAAQRGLRATSSVLERQTRPATFDDWVDVLRVDHDVAVAGLRQVRDQRHVEAHLRRPEAGEVAAPEDVAADLLPARDLFVPVGLGDQGEDRVIVAGAEDLEDLLVL